ncbi:MAG: hypothetical protein ACI9QD_000006 [Thermoproteota archaeon]|jgi:hypothetical protein
MFEKIKNLFTPSTYRKKTSKIKVFISDKRSNQEIEVLFNEYQDNFFKSPVHDWITENRYIKATFQELFSIIPNKTQRFFIDTAIIQFLPSSGKYSCALTKESSHVIIVFPELMQLLRSPMMDHSLAILTHELGHIIYEHGKKDIDPLEAQVEADQFSIDLGFAVQLEEFLESQPESIEKRVRMTYITPHILSND